MDSSRIIQKLKRISWWQAALLVVLVAFSYYTYLFLHRANFSASDVHISIEGPPSLKTEEEVSFEVKIQNMTKLELENVRLSIILPEFMRFKDGVAAEKRVELETIAPRQSFFYAFQVFAAQSEQQGDVKAHLEYTPRNLQGIFQSESEFPVSVTSLPLTVIFDVPSKAVNGQRLEGSFHFVAEEEILSPLFAKIIAPSSFTLNDADPALDSPPGPSAAGLGGSIEEPMWRFEKLERAKSYVVQFAGAIEGKADELKTFALVFGTEKDEGGFLEQYRVLREMRISSAPIDFTQTINGKETATASAGERLNIRIQYANKSNVDIEDLEITSKLAGDIFDISSLDPGLGYFNKTAGMILWNKNFIGSFARFGKDESGSVEFSVAIKSNISAKSYKNSGISGMHKATVRAGKVPLSLKGLSLEAQSEAEVKLRTQAKLFTKGYYYEGPFGNSGPIPPRVGEKTRYTIFWQVTNTLNEVNNARVEATLPNYISFEQKIYPSSNNLTYNADSHVIVWDIGALGAGIGTTLPVETVAFQVSIVPKEEMRGKSVLLIGQSKISGIDAFTNEPLEYVSEARDTKLPDDAGMREGDGVVQ